MLSDAHYARFLDKLIADRPDRVREVMEFRLLMEPEVAALAALRGAPEALERGDPLGCREAMRAHLEHTLEEADLAARGAR